MVINSENYVDKAEDVVKNKLKNNGKDKYGRVKYILTTSKIRNILSMVNELYNDVIHIPEEQLDITIVERIQYLRLRIVYEAGREYAVKDFIDQSGLLALVKEIGNSKSKFLLFCKYMEALVAYHKYYGGND